MSVTIIIPAYNEAKRLPTFLQSVLDYDASHTQQINEIIIVNDGSTDETRNIVQRQQPHKPKLKLINLPNNRGKGAAIREGVLNSNGNTEFIIFTDADGATPISELPKMLEALSKAQIGIGNRWESGSHVKKSTTLRHLAGWVYKMYMSLFGLGHIDTMCGFKGYRRAVAIDLFTNLYESRWLFDTEVAYKAIKKGYTIKNFPIEWESKDGSKLDTVTLIKSGIQILPLILKLNKNER